MASKLYLHAATTTVAGTLPAAGVSVSATSPTKIASGVNRSLDRTIGVAQTSQALSTNGTLSAQPSMIARFISPPVSAQTFASQVITGHIGGSESGAASNFQIRWVVALWRPSTGTKIGLITDLAATATLEPGTTETALNGATASSTSQTAIDGDVLVFEVWRDSTVQGNTNILTNTIFYDGTTEDSITTNAAYINFANTITFLGDGFGQAQALITRDLTTSLVSGTNTVVVTPSIAPPAHTLILAMVYQTGSVAVLANIPTATGAGMTWDQVNTLTDPSATSRRMTLFRSASDSPGSGAVTFDFGGQSQGSYAYSIIAVPGASIGANGADGIIQSGTNSNTGVQTGISVVLPGFISGHAAVGFARTNFGAAGFAPGSGYSLVGFDSASGVAVGVELSTYSSAPTPGTVDFSWTSVSGQALEIAAELNPPTGYAQAQAIIYGTKLFLRDAASDLSIGGEVSKSISFTQGSSVVNKVTNTVVGPTTGVQVTDTTGGTVVTWYSEPLRGGQSIANQTILAHIWGLESASTANVGLEARLFIVDQLGNYVNDIQDSEFGTELSTTTAVQSWGFTPNFLSHNINHGNRLAIQISGNDAGGTMAAGTFTTSYGAAFNVSGDSYIAINEVLLRGSNGFGQAQADIKVVSFGFGQAQTQITLPTLENIVLSTSGAIGLYLFEESTVAYDQTANNNGNYVGSLTRGTALNVGEWVGLSGFTSNAKYIQIKAAKLLASLTNSTIIISMSGGSADRAMYSERGSSGNDIWKVDIGVTSLRLVHRDDAGTLNFLPGTVNITSGTPHVVAITKTGTAVAFYVDGATDGTGTITGTDTFTDASIETWVGSDKGDTTKAWPGSIGFVALFNRALSQSEIQAIGNTTIVNKHTTEFSGQAQADIKVTTQVFAQAQTSIRGVGSSFGFGQSQADIKTTANALAQAQSDIKATSFGFAQSQADIKSVSTGFGQSQADIKSVSRGYAQSQSDIKVVSFGFAQTQSGIKAISTAFAQSQADIKVTTRVFAQAQSDTKVTSNVFAQSQSDIKVTSSVFAQSQADIKAKSNVFGQSQGDIKSTSQGYAQGQSDIKATSQGYANTQADIKVTSIQFAQAQGTILATYSQFAQTNADIKTINQNYAQAQSKINTFGVQSYGQSGAYIAGQIYAFGQTQADVKQTYNSFGQVQAFIFINEQYGFGQAQSDIKQTSQGYAQAQSNIKITSNAFGQAQGTIKASTNKYAQANADVKQTYQQFAQAQSDVKVTTTAYAQSNASIVIIVKSYAQSQATIKVTTNASGNAQADVQATYDASGQAQSRVRAVGYAFGQSQSYIKITRQSYGQAQATIRGNAFGQAQADILITSIVNANAQADIKVTVIVTGQATTLITSNFEEFGQAQALIRVISSVFAQSQAIITRGQVFGSAQAFIFQPHRLGNLTVSDAHSVKVTLSDVPTEDVGTSDTHSVKVIVSDSQPIRLRISDEPTNILFVSDTQY